MHDICFNDKTFDRAESKNYHLSVQISPDGLFFTILDLSKGKYIVLNGYPFFLKRPRLFYKQVKDIVEKEELLRLPFQSTEILFLTNLFTLVPTAFYSPGEAEKYLNFNAPLENGYVVRQNYFQRAQAWCIFAIPQNLSTYLEEIFPEATIRHDLFPLIENGLKNNLNHSTRQQVQLNFFRDVFEIVVLNGSKLVLCNIFNYQSEKDILYHVLNVIDQLKLSTEESELIINGHLPQVSPVYHLLKKYIRKTSFGKPGNTYQYSYTFNQVPQHYFSSLLSLYKCE